jgi:hypothetical protein
LNRLFVEARSGWPYPLAWLPRIALRTLAAELLAVLEEAAPA